MVSRFVTRQLAAAVTGYVCTIKSAIVGARISSLAILLFMTPVLTGCAGFFGDELSNRGGYLDKKLDSKWILADTKQMRILRAYTMIGSLARMSRENYYKSERQLIAQHVNSATRVAFDAYACAYARPGDCVYFDERMAELEVAVIRLAIAVFSKHENESLFQLVASQADDTAPLLKVLFSAGKIADAASTATDAVASTGKLIKSLLNLGEAAYFTGRRAGALYRDSIELAMIATLGSLDVQCQGAEGHAKNFSDPKDYQNAKNVFYQFYGYTEPNQAACAAFKKGLNAWRQGAGDLADWHDFLDTEAVSFRKDIIPGEGAFIQASDLIWRSCEQIAESDSQLAVCLGHRGPDASPRECNIDNAGNVRINAKKLDTEEEWKKHEISYNNWDNLGLDVLKKDTCRLILYAKTWAARNDRLRSKSDARLYWLSLGGSAHIANRAVVQTE